MLPGSDFGAWSGERPGAGRTRETLPIFLMLAVLISYTVLTNLGGALSLPWYYNTEEFPFVQEVLRFVEGDFRQEFFDIPGTPLITLATLLWWPAYKVCSIAGCASASDGARAFSLEHIQALYVMMRLLSCLFFALSVSLTYAIGRRILNRAGGAAAALLLALHPVLGMSLYHLRIEPANLFVVLLAWWLILQACDRQSYGLFLLSGGMAGLAMALRFPSILASLPLVTLYAWLYPVTFLQRWTRTASGLMLLALACFVMTGGSLCALVRWAGLARNWLTDGLLLTVHSGHYPRALSLVQNLWLAMGLAAFCVTFALSVPWVRSKARALLWTPIVPVLFGSLAGFVLGVPSIFWSGNFFLRSLDMFIDRNRAVQEELASLGSVIRYYLIGDNCLPVIHFSADSHWGILPTQLHLILFLAGVLACLLCKRKDFIPLLVAFAIGLISQYGKLQTIRHLTAWLPMASLIMALPVAWLTERHWFRLRGTRVAGCLVFLTAGLVLVTESERLRAISLQVDHFREKRRLMPPMEEWLAQNTTSEDPVFLICSEPMNGAVILKWIESNGVTIPPKYRAGLDRFIPWFGDIQSLLQEGQGYIVLSKCSYQARYLDYYAQVSPEKITDPFHDSHFKLCHTIDSGLENTWMIFRFNFSNGGSLPPALSSVRTDNLRAPDFLSDLPEAQVHCYTDGNWGFGKHGFSGQRPRGKVSVARKLYRESIGMHALSQEDAWVRYDLNAHYAELQGGVALNDSSPQSASLLTFLICGDGKVLWSSTRLQEPGSPQFFQVDVHGVKQLELRVTCSGSNYGAHAVWISPCLFSSSQTQTEHSGRSIEEVPAVHSNIAKDRFTP